MNQEIEIYIAAHKKFNFPYIQDIYTPLQVGAEGKNDLGYLRDNVGENISKKNSNYCELTGMYWIWKNSNKDIVGLVHYRRFFYNTVFCGKANILNEVQIRKLLDQYDLIVAKRGYTWFRTVKDQFTSYHIASDLEATRNAINKLYPDYLDAFDEVMESNNYCPLNMIITRKEIFDNYCEWLFNILFEVEKNISLNNRDVYNSRVFGFLSERLFNVWLLKNKQYKFIEKPVFNNEKNMIVQKIEHIIKCIIKG